MVRVPKDFRGNIDRGTLVRVSLNGKCKVLIVEGKTTDDPEIYMDLRTRAFFDVKRGQFHEVTIERVNWYTGSLLWAFRHANPGLRVSSQLGILSLVLAVIPFIPSLFSFIVGLFASSKTP
jgi:hypothetical protein